MPLRAPGPSDEDMRNILIEVRRAQQTLDAAIAEAQALPDTEPSKTLRIQRYNALKRQVNISLRTLQRQTNLWANEAVPRFYSQGFTVAGATLDAGYDFSLIHQEAVEHLVRDAQEDVATGLQQVQRNFGDRIDAVRNLDELSSSKKAIIRAAGKSAVSQQLLTGLGDPQDIAQALRDELWAQDVSIIDRAGRNWNMETYTRMLVRTKSAQAYNSGSLMKYAEEGVSRVRVFDGVVHDEECARANGQVWTMKYAQNHIISHPNCRRAFGPMIGDGRVNKAEETERIRQALGIAADIERAYLIGKALRKWIMNDGVVELHDNEIIKRLKEFELEHWETERIGTTIRAMERGLEDILDPAAARIGLIDDVPDHVPPDWDYVREKLVRTLSDDARRALDETKEVAEEAELLLPALPAEDVPREAVEFFEESSLSDVKQAMDDFISDGEELVPDNLDLEAAEALRDFFSELTGSKVSREIKEEVAGVLLRSDELALVDADDLIGDIWEMLEDVLGVRLNTGYEYSSSLAVHPLSVLLRLGREDMVKIMEAVGGGTSQIWIKSGMRKVLAGNVPFFRFGPRLVEGVIQPLRDGIAWLDGIRELHPQAMVGALRHVFGSANVGNLQTSGAHGTIWTVTLENGDVIGFKHLGHAVSNVGALGSIFGDVSQFVLGRRLGMATFPYRFISEGRSGRVWMIMPIVPDVARLDGIASEVVSAYRYRQLGFLETLLDIGDTHGGNYLVRTVRGRSVIYSIDNEVSLQSNLVRQGNAFDPVGLTGITTGQGNAHYRSYVLEWLGRTDNTGRDLDVDLDLANRPFVGAIRLSPEEADAYRLDQGFDIVPIWSRPDEIKVTWTKEGLITIDGQWFPGQFVIPSEPAPNWAIAHPTPVQYLTKTEVEVLDDFLNGRLDADLFGAIQDAIDDLPEGHLSGLVPDGWSDPLDFFDDLIRRQKEKAQRYLDEGIWVRDAVIEIENFGSGPGVGHTIRMGEFVELFDDSGERFAGVINHIYEDSNGNRIITMMRGLSDPLNPPVRPDDLGDLADISFVRISETDIPRNLEGIFDQAISETRDLYAGRSARSPYPNALGDDATAHRVSARQRLVRVAETDEFGVFSGFRTEKIDIDGSFVEFTPVGPKQLPALAEDLQQKATQIIIDELEAIPPEYRPRTIRIHSEQIEYAPGEFAYGRYDPETRSIDLSIEQAIRHARGLPEDADSFSAIIEALDWERVRKTLRHELGHALERQTVARMREELTLVVLRDLMDEALIVNPDMTWRELDLHIGSVLATTDEIVRSEETGEFLLKIIVERRVDDLIEVLERNRRLELIKWLDKAPAHSWLHDYTFGPDSDVPAEIMAEAWRVVRELFEDTLTPPPNMPEELYWGLFSNQKILAVLNGDVDLPPAFEPWGLEELIRARIRDGFLLELSEESLTANRLVDEILSGGFTFDTVAQEFAERGHAVAIAANEHRLDPLNDIFNGNETAFRKALADEKSEEGKVLRARLKRELIEYEREHRDLLDEEGWYLGLWFDEEDTSKLGSPHVFFDTSRVFPDDFDAVSFGIQNDQFSVFDLENFTTIVLKTEEEQIYRSVQEYVRLTKPRATPNKEDRLSVLVGTRKKAGEEIEVVLRRSNGEPAPMNLRDLPEDLQRKIVETVKNRWAVDEEPVTFTVDLVEDRYRRILEQALTDYRKNPALRDEDEFYQFWLAVFTDQEQKFLGQSGASITLQQMAGAAAEISPNINAVENLPVAVRMANYVHEDRALRTIEIEPLQETLDELVDLYRSKGDLETAAEFSVTVRPGMKTSDVSEKVALEMMRVFYYRDTGRKMPIRRAKAKFYTAIRILRGDVEVADQLSGPKVRSFYNNIIDPDDLGGFFDFTSDFQMANAAFWARGADVVDNTSALDTPKKFAIPLGVRAIIGEAARRIYDDLAANSPDILEEMRIDSLAELQEVIWATWKRGVNRDIWGHLGHLHRRGKPIA